MRRSMIFVGDVNLMGVTDPAVPFRRVLKELQEADVVFGDLECCLYEAPRERSPTEEGFYAAPSAGPALRLAGFDVVGTANNVTYGSEAILASLAELNKLGIAHMGAGANRDQAHAPAIVERAEMRFGFLQRTSTYWPTNHEAGPTSPGVAVLRAHTAYQVPVYRTRPDIPPIAVRPGVAPEILTWADKDYLSPYLEEIANLKRRADIVVASHHWGLFGDVLQYMTEIGHAAIDAGADIVIGHGPHYSLPVELYREKPIFYGLGSFSFNLGHRGKMHGNWIGMMARVELEEHTVEEVSFQFVRHNDNNETLLRLASEESETLEKIAERSEKFGTRLTDQGSKVVVSALM